MEPFEDRDIVVVDLGFGDAGKGATVDWLCSDQADLGVAAVVRFNGGAQAAHNVTVGERHHTFSQFGSGTLSGVPTFLSRFVLVEPIALAREARALEALGVRNPFDLIRIDVRALLTTPIHVAANRAREDARGGNRHGSCGKGIGETAAYALEVANAPTVGDCRRPDSLRRKLSALATFYGPLIAESRHGFPPIDDMVDMYAEFGAVVDIADPDALGALGARGRLVFEGAQGVLLDEWRGFHPHTTWSTVEPSNARAMIDELGRDSYVLGVTRTYMTRHGAGPFPTEDPELAKVLPELHNGTGEYQGGFRMGPPRRVVVALRNRGERWRRRFGAYSSRRDGSRAGCRRPDPRGARVRRIAVRSRRRVEGSRSPAGADRFPESRRGRAEGTSGRPGGFRPVSERGNGCAGSADRERCRPGRSSDAMPSACMMDGVDQSLVSIDVIALRFGNPEPGMLRLAVTPRQAEPYTGQLALPGVLLGAGERLQDAARRAVTTKLGIPDEKILVSGQLTVFDEPNRDPRGPTLSVTMWAVISSDEVPGSAEWVSWDNPGDLAFDHNRIVADTRPILADTLLWRDQAFTRALLGPSFPASYALAVAEELSGVRPDPGNLNRTLKALPGLERTDERVRVSATGRPAVVWAWTENS